MNTKNREEVKKLAICKKCGEVETYEVKKSTSLCLYCKECDGWITNKKYDTTGRTKEDYKREYMQNQPATQKQMRMIRSVVRYGGPVKSKYHAMQIIKEYTGE